MKQIREGTFETNSSSTHTLVVTYRKNDNYLPLAKHILIEWIDTNDYYVLESLKEKVSYLVSHIANKLKWDCNKYDELLEEIQDNYEYKQINEYLKKTFDKEIRFPEDSNYLYETSEDLECITEINHQLIPWGSGSVVDEVLNELIEYRQDKDENRLHNKEEECDLSFEQKLDIYLANGNYVAFGRD